MAINKNVNINVGVKGADKSKRAFSGIESSMKSMIVTGLSIAGVKKGLDATTGAAVKQQEIFRKLQTQVELSGKSSQALAK